MKLTTFVAALAAGSLSLTPALAHDLWVNAHVVEPAGVEAEIGYGHDYPRAETIEKGRVHLFEPLKLVGEGSIATLRQVGENYLYAGSGVDNPGTFFVVAEYRPTYWSKNQKGWEQQNRTEMKDAEYCTLATMFGKRVLTLGEATCEDFVARPLGHKLEIIPLQHPAAYKVGKPFRVKILFDGKPLKTAPVTATYAGYLPNASAFYGHTDLRGEIDILPLRAGQWLVQVKHATDHHNPAVCDQESYAATLTFDIER